MTRKRIGLVGYFGFGNYGDELFVSVYKKFFHDCEIVRMHDSINAPFYGDALLEKIDKLDAIIIGGGDLIIPNAFPTLYYDERFLRRPVFYHGVGVPSWIGEDAGVIERIKAFYTHPSVKKINVRDLESKAWVDKRFAPSVAVDHSVDMVFSLDLPKPIKPAGQKVFGLILRKFAAEPERWRNVKRLCDRAREQGYAIKTIVLATGRTRQDDLESLASFDYPDAEVVCPDDLDTLTREIGTCDVVASMKFHGVVVAFAYGIPAISLSTTDKFVNLCRRADRMDLSAHIDHPDLPDRLPRFPVRIPSTTLSVLKQEATQSMVRLRHAVLNEVD